MGNEFAAIQVSEMTFANILTIVDGAQSSAASLEAGLLLGRRFSCRVDVLHVEPDAAAMVPIVGEGMSGAAVEQIVNSFQAEAETRAKAAREVFDALCESQNLPCVEAGDEILPEVFCVSFQNIVGHAGEQIISLGRLADIIVLARPGHGDDVQASPSFDAALFDCGRPVVLVPPEPVLALGDTVAIAWNRSRESARAVAAAMPILRCAGKVFIMTARENDAAPEPSELARTLAGHGIEAKTWAFIPGRDPIGDCLMQETRKAGADLLVMGAYGHSRLRETILGGVTRDVLNRGVIPIMLVH